MIKNLNHSRIIRKIKTKERFTKEKVKKSTNDSTKNTKDQLLNCSSAHRGAVERPPKLPLGSCI